MVAWLLAGCLRGPDYRCASATDCGAQGTCQPGGHCSFADPSCATGQRFGELSGAFAGQCVGAGGDAGVTHDAPIGRDAETDAPHGSDASIDASTSCPGSYASLSGGESGHVYRLITASTDWQTQVDTCAGDSPTAYLAIPGNNGELSAIRSLAGANAWIGIDDITNPGTYVTVLGAAATYLPWGPGQPDTSQHCAYAKNMSNRIATAACASPQIGVCECAP
jgi:hypothetical protein